MQFARDENLGALDALFTYHGAETLPYRLAILGNLPETKSPNEYVDLLPALEDGEVEEEEEEEDAVDRECVDWPRQVWRIQDWTETGKFAPEMDAEGNDRGGGVGSGVGSGGGVGRGVGSGGDVGSGGGVEFCTSPEDVDDGSFLYDFMPEYYRKFESSVLTKSLVEEWFAARAEELEAYAGQVRRELGRVLKMFGCLFELYTIYLEILIDTYGP